MDNIESCPKDDLLSLIQKIGIKKLAMKVDNLKIYDEEKIHFIIQNYNLIQHQHGKFLLIGCIEEKLYHKLLYLDILSVKDEVTAINLLER